jgi:hypothetical protein
MAKKSLSLKEKVGIGAGVIAAVGIGVYLFSSSTASAATTPGGGGSSSGGGGGGGGGSSSGGSSGGGGSLSSGSGGVVSFPGNPDQTLGPASSTSGEDNT